MMNWCTYRRPRRLNMQFEELGNMSGKTLMLLPGTCCDYQTNFGTALDELSKKYHLICVNYDGFDGSGSIFPDMITVTKKIEKYIKDNHNGRLDGAIGSSLGSSFVGQLVQRENVHIDHAIFGSPDLDQSGKVAAKLQSMLVVPLLTSFTKGKVEVGDTNLHTLFQQLFSEIEAENSHWNSGTDKGVLVEEEIIQHKDMAVYHPASVNSVRMTTINLGDGDIRMWYPVVRIGVGGNFLSSGAAGSIVAGINTATGITETTGSDEWGKTSVVHPDTHIPIKGIKIPRWRQLCEKAVKMAERLPTLRYIGWDFVYDKDKEWIVMEGNENAEILSQFVYHRGEREEFEQLIGYKSTKEYWWQGKYPSRFENIE